MFIRRRHGQDGPVRFLPLLRGGLLGLFVILGVVLAHGYRFPASNHTMELPPILAMLDPGLYPSDYFVQEMLLFTPRTYYNVLLSLLAGTGLGVTGAYALVFALALASFLAGLYAIARTCYRSRMAAAVLVFWALSATAGTLGESELWPAIPIPTAFAMGVSIWGLYYSLRRAWIAAYAFFGAACLLQFLVGLLPALLISPLLLLDAWRQRAVWRPVAALSLFALGAGLVYVPMLLQGTTGTGLLSDRAFVDLYVFRRVPHHLAPSAWPVGAWIEFVLFYAGGVLCLFRTRSLPAVYRLGIVVVVGMMLAGLLVNGVFTEGWPWAWVAKLHLPRMTPVAGLAVLFGLSVLFYENLRQRRGVVCMTLAVVPVSHHPGVLLLLFALALPALENAASRFRGGSSWWLGVLIAVALYRLPISYDPVLWAQALVHGPLLLGVLLAPWLVRRWAKTERAQTASAAALAALAAAALLVATSGMLPPRLHALVAKQVTVDGVWGDDPVRRLALRFRAQSNREALVLVPPAVQHFALYARRSVVVHFKAIPFTDRGMLEWQERLDAITACENQPPECLVEVARRYGAGYVLCEPGRDVPGEAVDREGGWVIRRLADGASGSEAQPTTDD